MHVTTVVAEVTQQNKWKRKKGVTMNSNSLEEEEKESAYFYLCFLVSILLPSCSETKKAEETDREARHMEREVQGRWEKKGDKKRQTSQGSVLL